MMQEIALDLIQRNESQPRQEFDPARLAELAASIRQNGLKQPITVRPIEGGRFEIVMGERRFRAHKLLQEQGHLSTILCQVRAMDEHERDVDAILENLQRVDISPLEEARAFKRMLDAHGYDHETLAAKLGIQQPWRIRDRVQLLDLREEYLGLLASGQLTPSQAYEMSRLSPAGQDVLFRAIKRGECPDYNQLVATARKLLEGESQVGMFGGAEDDPGPSDEQKRDARKLEDRVTAVCNLLAKGFKDGEIVALQKVNPSRLTGMADEIKLIRKHLADLEKALRAGAVQNELFTSREAA